MSSGFGVEKVAKVIRINQVAIHGNGYAIWTVDVERLGLGSEHTIISTYAPMVGPYGGFQLTQKSYRLWDSADERYRTSLVGSV